MDELNNITERITGLRENLEKIVSEKSQLTDMDVITASEDLDELLNLFIEQMILKSESVLD